MIGKITRGADAGGLVRYLMGPGAGNEHTQQHVIAAGAGMAVPVGRELDTEERESLGWELDLPRRLHGTRVTRQVRNPDGELVRRDAHVWHVSLSNPAGDRRLSDEEWADVARDVMRRMGWDGSDGQAPVPWVAIHHGVSSAGNDHVHIAAVLIRSDGRAARTSYERLKVGAVCKDAEQRLGLTIVLGRHEGALPTVAPVEHEAAAARRLPEPDRTALARRVRAAATASRDEAEFVRRLRADGLIVRPRHAKGGGSVEGYSVALRPASAGVKPIRYGGHSLGRDLSLPALRARWGPSSDPQAALSEWTRRRSTPAGPGREAHRWTPAQRQEAAQQLRSVVARLAAVPAAAREAWASAAREASGVLANLSTRLEPTRPGPIAAASDALASAAQEPAGTPHLPPDVDAGPWRDVAAVAGQAAMAGGPVAWLAVLSELRRTARAIEQAATARGRAHLAEEGARLAVSHLESLHAKWRELSPPAPIVGKDHEHGMGL